MITVRAPSSFSGSMLHLIQRYSAVAVLGTFAQTAPEDEM